MVSLSESYPDLLSLNISEKNLYLNQSFKGAPFVISVQFSQHEGRIVFCSVLLFLIKMLSFFFVRISTVYLVISGKMIFPCLVHEVHQERKPTMIRETSTLEQRVS